MDDDRERLEALEVKAAYLEDTVERLNAAVIRLAGDLKALSEDFSKFRENLEEEGPDVREIEPPPHY